VTTVAIIEDDDELRELTRQFLCAEGFHAVGVASAEELSEVAVLPSLYIVDLNLPGTDGYTLIRRLREVCPTAGVVVFSARDRTVDVTRGYEVGADIYLTKPVDPTICWRRSNAWSKNGWARRLRHCAAWRAQPGGSSLTGRCPCA